MKKIPQEKLEMRQDICFLLDQLHTIEHEQDNGGIRAMCLKYGHDPLSFPRKQ